MQDEAQPTSATSSPDLLTADGPRDRDMDENRSAKISDCSASWKQNQSDLSPKHEVVVFLLGFVWNMSLDTQSQ